MKTMDELLADEVTGRIIDLAKTLYAEGGSRGMNSDDAREIIEGVIETDNCPKPFPNDPVLCIVAYMGAFNMMFATFEMCTHLPMEMQEVIMPVISSALLHEAAHMLHEIAEYEASQLLSE